MSGRAFMDPADLALLADVQRALSSTFRDPVRVGGVLVPRKLARQIEAPLLRLRVTTRRLAAPASGAGDVVCHEAATTKEVHRNHG